jgi:hypothetical protein
MLRLACIRPDVSHVSLILPPASAGFLLGLFFEPEDKADMFL